MKSYILITGASTGLGKTICEHLDDQGLWVIAAMRNTESCNWLEKRPNITPLQLDVANTANIKTLNDSIKKITENSGKLIAIVNNAGVCISAPLETVAMDDLRYQLEVNVIGVMGVTQALLPDLLTNQGTIINIGSGVGRIAPPFLGPYAASKSALEAMTDSLRRELSCTGVKTTLIVPGAIPTPVWGKISESTENALEGMTKEQNDRYRRSFTKFSNDNARSADSSKTTPQDVADRVFKILTSKKIKPSYTVGKDAAAGTFLGRLLPTTLVDIAFRKMIAS